MNVEKMKEVFADEAFVKSLFPKGKVHSNAGTPQETRKKSNK